MSQHSREPRQYLVAMIVGAVVGGVVVAVATKAIPRIMAQMMSEMPQKMMAQMKAEGLEPADMCQRMMANFKPAQPSEESTVQSQN